MCRSLPALCYRPSDPAQPFCGGSDQTVEKWGTRRTSLSPRQSMDHPTVIQPARYAQWRPDKMGKATLFESSRLLIGLNAFEPGQTHELHSHEGMDKLYYVLEGDGLLLLEGRQLTLRA